MSQNLDINAVIGIAEPLVIDLIGWIRQRHADTGTLPSNEEVIARAKGTIATILQDGAAALAEFPPDPSPPAA